MDYLAEITVYLNDSCRQTCVLCDQFYLQVPCCTANRSPKYSLSIDMIETLFHEIRGCNIINVNITGGDIFEYPYWDNLKTLLNLVAARKNFYVHYLSVADHAMALEKFRGGGMCLKMPVTFPLDVDKFKNAWGAIIDLGLNAVPVFIIQDSDEYNRVEELLSGIPIKTADFFPFFNGNNINFFKENFFIDKAAIEMNKPSQRDIYINETVNSIYFGKINVFPSGNIHAGINAPKLGTLGKDSLYYCVYKEMKEGVTWRKIRKNVLPCKRCGFEKLCPPISDYNAAIGKYDLCNNTIE